MKRLKIWLEATNIFMSPTRHQSGIGYYTENIIRSLIELDSDNDFIIVANLFVTNKPKQLAINSNSKNYHYKFIRFLPGKVWNQFIKHRLLPPINRLVGGKPDVMINFDFVRLPVSKGVRTITAIHDLSFLHYPDFVQPRNLARLKKFVPLAIKNSDGIITISESTRQDLVKLYKADLKKINIVNPAIDNKIYKPQSKPIISRVKGKYNISGEYILYTGTLEPRKNIVGILEAYNRLSDNLKKEYTLVLAGGKGWLDDAIQEKLEELKHLNIIKTGYVDEEDLPPLYSGASLFVYPSFYEGFGMPPLEAMACGTPVITSNNSSLPEVVGDAGIMIDAQDIDSLTYNIEKVIKNKKLQKEMIIKGLKQAKKFSWNKSAKDLLNIINSID